MKGKEQDLQDQRVARRRIDKKVLELSRPKDWTPLRYFILLILPLAILHILFFSN